VTGNSQFKFVKLKRGFHLSKFWHSEGHTYLQWDASHIAALIRDVSPADVSFVRPPKAPAATPPCLSSSCCCCPTYSTPVSPPWYHPFIPAFPLCSLLRKAQEQSRMVRLEPTSANADPIMHMERQDLFCTYPAHHEL